MSERYNYKDHLIYLQSQQWDWVRRKVIDRDKCCQDCGEKWEDWKWFEVHHNSYKRWKQSGEDFDCVLLCRKCHNLRHNPIPTISEVERNLEKLLYEA